MSLYNYLMTKSGQDATKAAKLAEEAYARFKGAVGAAEEAAVGQFKFAFMHDKGYESFAWKPNDVVNVPANGGSGQPVLGIVSGYYLLSTGRWTVVVQTATSKDVWRDADQLREASFPPGLVEIIRKKFGEVD